MKNIKEIITSIISSDPKPIINVVQADGDVTFHIKLKECNISKEDCTNSLLFTRFFVNFIGEFLVRQNIDIFASILIGLDHALYQKMVCTCSHHDFGMIIGSDFVGDLDIRNDTDKIELYEDEFSINDSPDEVYDIDEEFDIQVLG